MVKILKKDCNNCKKRYNGLCFGSPHPRMCKQYEPIVKEE